MQTDTRPIHLKLREQIAEAIMTGQYSEGDLLPSVRSYAAKEGANPLTVAKAYQYFRQAGLVEVRRGIGMVVCKGAAENLRRVEREKFMTRDWPRIRKKMSILDITVSDLTAKP